MAGRRYKQGLCRQQTMLLPPSVDDYITEHNTTRAIDVYVESLDLDSMDFRFMDAGSALGGGPAYPPRALLKLYIYGYLNRVRSSRRLEREARINLELIWLLEGFKPSHATIANFRKDNRKGIKAANRDFTRLCKELALFGGTEVGIDGTFMHANASKASIHTQKKMEQQLAQLNQAIDAYLEELDQNDQTEPNLHQEDAALAEKLERLRARQKQTQARLEAVKESEETQYSEIDPDARLLNKRGQTIAGYNVQIAVDAQHKLIVCHEVINDGNDTQQLAPMALKAQAELGTERLIVDADSGYDNREQIKTCVDAGITPYVPLANLEARTRQQGRFSSSDFTYDEEQDSYQCPSGERLNRSGSYTRKGKKLYKYASKARQCAQCPLHQQCLPAKTGYRQLYRWEHETIIDEHRQRMQRDGREKMRTRAALAEHPFGTMKRNLGWNHFLMRGFEKVRAEMNLQVLVYNFKRVLNILGVSAFENHLKRRISFQQGR